MISVIEKIYKSSLKFLVSLPPKETYKIIVKEASSLVGTKYGSIFLMENENFHRVYTSVPPSSQIAPRKRGYTYRSYMTGKSYVISRKIINRIHPENPDKKTKSIVIIPLRYKNRSIGVLTVQSEKIESFTRDDLKILKLFGATASLAIQKNQLFTEIKNSLDTRDLFISMAAHELKTPLTAIYGYAQLLHKSLSKRKAKELPWVQTLENETLRLTFLINELLQVNQIKTGRLKYYWKENFLNEIIQRMIDSFIMSHPKRKLIVKNELRKNDSLWSDFDKLMQVLINIMNNADKFSSPTSEIVVSAKAVNKYFIISVKDKGIGIPKSDVNKVFEGFYKGRSSKEGMGIGLFLAKNIIEEHRGTIKIDSRENMGTTVVIKLPRRENDKIRPY